MDWKRRYVTAGLAASAIVMVSCSSGLAVTRAQCLTVCDVTFDSDQSKCQSSLTDVTANIRCAQDAINARSACIDRCPKDSRGTNPDNHKVRPRHIHSETHWELMTLGNMRANGERTPA